MQTVVEFNPGTHTISIPAEATGVIGEAIGSGAPGANGSSDMCGAGGAGGWFVRRDLSSLAGQTVQVVVPDNGQGTTINAGGNVEVYAPGGSSPSGVNLPSSGNGYTVANNGGSGGMDRAAAGTGGHPGHEGGGGRNGVDGGGVTEGPGADATVPGQGGDGGGHNSPGGLGGPGFARITYDMPDPVEPPPAEPPAPVPQVLAFFASGDAIYPAADGVQIVGDEIPAIAARLNLLYLER